MTAPYPQRAPFGSADYILQRHQIKSASLRQRNRRTHCSASHTHTLHKGPLAVLNGHPHYYLAAHCAATDGTRLALFAPPEMAPRLRCPIPRLPAGARPDHASACKPMIRSSIRQQGRAQMRHPPARLQTAHASRSGIRRLDGCGQRVHPPRHGLRPRVRHILKRSCRHVAGSPRCGRHALGALRALRGRRSSPSQRRCAAHPCQACAPLQPCFSHCLLQPAWKLNEAETLRAPSQLGSVLPVAVLSPRRSQLLFSLCRCCVWALLVISLHAPVRGTNLPKG